MAMAVGLDVDCILWPVESDDFDEVTETMLSIDVCAQVERESPIIYGHIDLEIDSLRRGADPWDVIRDKLTDCTGLPDHIHPHIIRHMLQYIMQNEEEILDAQGLISMVLSVSISDRPPEIEGQISVVLPVFVGTSAEGCSPRVSEQCVICLENIANGTKATQLPCAHLYHQSCITEWLTRSNHCPPCRYQMPSN